MSTPSPAKVVHGVKEEGRGTGTTPVKVRRGGAEEEERSAATGTTPVKVAANRVEEEERSAATGTTPMKVVANRVEEGSFKAAQKTPVNVKAEPAMDDSLINIKVHSQTADDVFFRVKRDVKLRRLIDMYCRKQSLDPKAVTFLGPDGRYILADHTPEEAGLEDGDAIDIVLTQTGGAVALLRATQLFA